MADSVKVGFENFMLNDARCEFVQQPADVREKLAKDRERLREDNAKHPIDCEQRQQIAEYRQQMIADQEHVAVGYQQIDKVRKHMMAKAEEARIEEE